MAGEPWLEDLLGYRQFLLGPTGSVKLPMRAKIRLSSGIVAVDDPVAGVTDLSVSGGGSGGSSGPRWTVNSEAERLALAVTAADVGQQARQIEQNGDSTFWILKRVSGGVLWGQIDNTVSSSGAPVGAQYLVAAANVGLSAARILAGVVPVIVSFDTAGYATISVATALGGGAPAAGLMSGADKVKLDGITPGAGAAPLPATSTPLAITDSAGSPGTTTGTPKFSCEDHAHAHGNRGGGTLHATALGGGSPVAGFMSGADKVKLDGIATGANIGPSVATVAPPVLTDATSALGTTTGTPKYAIEDHTHGHGNRAGGALHATALGGGSPAAGFMSGADKVAHDANTTKLAGLPSALTIDTTTVPLANTDAGAAGSGTAVAPINHRHPHGTGLAGGTTHATAVGGGSPVAGFMSGADKVAVDGFPAQIAAKADKQLLDNPISVASYTLPANADDYMLRMTSLTAQTITVPPVASVSTRADAPINVLRYGNGTTSGVVTITAGAGVTLLPANNLRLANHGDMAQLIRVVGDVWKVQGEAVT